MVISPAAKSERSLRVVGLILWCLGMLVGGGLLIALFLVPPALSKHPIEAYQNMGIAAALAFPAVFVYLWVPVLVDRYDPEPWWCLALAFFWGAVAACGFAATINTLNEWAASEVLGKEGGALVGAVVSAPLVEEAFKAMAVLGMFWFLRREFDGVVDGVIYATFSALGFAAVENVIYYSRGIQKGGAVGLIVTFVLRGLLAPWGHPLYTSMTGLGIGIARETNRGWLKFVAPMLGYAAAVTLHAIWNGSAAVVGTMGSGGGLIFIVLLLLWFVFVFAFACLVIWLVAREGKIIRRFLQDEVLLGNLTPAELELVCSPWGRLKTAFAGKGRVGRRFVDAASRLALSKWHTARAMQGHKRTLSVEYIAPLRRELYELRQAMYTRR